MKSKEMTSSYQKYSAYKDSGVDWLGEIPEGWEVKKLKNLVGINKNSLAENTSSNIQFDYVDIGSVTFENGIEKVETFIFKNAPSRARRIAEQGDTIISTVRTYLKAIDFISVAKEKYIYSTGFAILNPNKIINKFLFHFVRSSAFTEQVMFNSTGMSYPAINSTDLGRLFLAIPKAKEQTAIANFLDQKTTQIDTAIAQKEKLIALLKERKQIIIQEAVTRGLDPEVKMKDSGVEWIGEIPEHWEVKRAKYIFFQQREEPSKSDGVVTAFRDGEVTLRSNRRTAGFTVAILEGGYQKVRPGQLVINSMDAFAGAIGVSDSEGKCTPEYVVCESFTDNIFLFYFAFLIREMALAKYIQVICNAVRQRAIRFRYNNLKDQFLPIPPLSEQKAIVGHINSQSAKIDETITMQQTQIEKLKEYKAVLIDAAVTGKIKVSA